MSLEFEPEFYNQNSQVQFNLGLKTLTELNAKNGEIILDIGCGTGQLTIEIAKKIPNGCVIGLDINSHMIAKAKENAQNCGLTNIQFISKGILHYQSSIQFNAIFSNSALHWVPDTRQLYQRIYDLLKPGGRLVAQIPTKGSLSNFIPLFFAPLKHLQITHHFRNWNYPVKLHSPSFLRKILTSIGFIHLKLWVMKQSLSFQTPHQLLDFLRSAALVPILSQLPPSKKAPYLDYILTLIQSKAPTSLQAEMKRLFIHVEKGSCNF
ncbi:MAG: class I SAM-dependent methyltransferase [Candidatus Helarchaeota archaeon]